MFGSFMGQILRIATFGESHGPAVGVVIDGLPAGLAIDEALIQRDLDRRRPGTSPYVTQRKEADTAQILSGLADGRTLGTPLCVVVHNTDARSKDYGELLGVFRPGHADFAYHAKYGAPPQPGGGRSSGRETVGRVAAGAVARAILAPLGVVIRACTAAVGQVRAARLDWDFAAQDPLRCPDPDAAPAMADAVAQARAEGDSVGGLVRLVVSGAPAGLGDPVFGKLDARLGGAMFSIGGVKGVEIGAGFAVAQRSGGQNNDAMDENGFRGNNAGGVLGGISTGQEITMLLAVKPTPSIGRPQQTIGLDGQPRLIQIKGRHDPCLCPRIAPVAEAMAALVLADAYLAQRALAGAAR